MNINTPTTEILKNVKLLVFSILLLISAFTSVIIWQESKKYLNYDLENNYHAATSARLSDIHNEILKIESNFNRYSHQDLNSSELKKLKQKITRSLHIISQKANDIWSIQEKYKNPKFTGIINRLQSQLNKLTSFKDTKIVTSVLTEKIQLKDLYATILTLKQFDRLHKSAKNELYKSIKQKDKKNLIIVSTLIAAALLAIAFITKRAITSIQIILSNNKQAEENLRRTKKMDALGKLTGGVAHDYNNMLGIILGYAELLELALKDQPKLKNYAHQISHAGQRGAKLTTKLLAFSAYKTHSPEKINLNQLLDNQKHMLQKTLTARIDLKLELDDDLWPVWADKSDLEDAIINLCINSMHATTGSGKLTIRTHNEHINHNDSRRTNCSSGDYISLSFIDNGCGMDSSTIEKIFDPFYSTKGEKGTGLGLSQVHGFMERNKGEIEVESEIAKGSQFILYFPRHYGVTEDNHQEPPVTKEQGSETILIVDDEAELRELNAEILKQNGYRTICAETAKQALDILENKAVDLIFTDIIMPDMDGYQLIEVVRKQYPETKIQLTSGFTGNSTDMVLNKNLQKNILLKPYNSQTLLKQIRSALDSA